MRPLTAVLSLGLALPAGGAPTLELPEPKPSQALRDSVRDLGSPNYRLREAASRRLLAAGASAVVPLVEAMPTGEPEVVERGFRILRELLLGDDPRAVRTTRAALEKLAGGRGRPAAEARALLNQCRDRARARLTSLGAVFADGVSTRAVSLDAVSDLAAALPLLGEIPELEEVSLSNRRFNDEGMKHLLPLTGLRELNLCRSGVGNNALRYFKEFPRLEWVPMGWTRVTDEGLVHLMDLKQLVYVGLRGDRVTDAGVARLRKLTNLTGLNLAETRVTDAGLGHLRDMQQLSYLRLDDTAVTDAGLEKLHGLKRLATVGLRGTRVTDQGFRRLRQAIPVLGPDE